MVTLGLPRLMTTSSAAPGSAPVLQLPGTFQAPPAGFTQLTVLSNRRSSSNSTKSWRRRETGTAWAHRNDPNHREMAVRSILDSNPSQRAGAEREAPRQWPNQIDRYGEQGV